MKRSLGIIATLLCVLSCTQKEEVADSLEIVSGAPLKEFAAAGGESGISLDSSIPWTACVTDSKVNWITVSPSSGGAGKTHVSIIAGPNGIAADRSATVKFTAGKISREVEVRQLSADVLSCSLSPAEMPAAGGRLTLQVSSNIDYTVEVDASCTDWVTSSDTKAIDINSYHYFISPNRADNDRTGELTVKSKDGIKTVKFIQKGDNGTLPKAEGYIRYSDGTPAQGVVVSDGFNCVKTDRNGFYRLYPGTDCRYVYFSYPSDCKISLNGNGQPDFFKEYRRDRNDYDFTLTKASVENEFTLFALADPQAHYKVRGSQKKPDTDRFRLETVPALNSAISESGSPCYGVTLGDIVYSEDSRNSNPGMSVMRDNFKLVDMPVFQTMGNHDFTFFYGSSNKLSIDERSSTLHLKAQRAFEDTFGPVNYSFNRGSVHIVCMRNIIYDSATDNLDYHGGFTDEQYEWLLEDLAEVGKDKMVILCVHIPLAYMSSGEHRQQVVSLLAQYTNSTIFSGHTHYARTYTQIQSTYMTEHIHQAVCGQWWWSNVEADGCPNGYTVYNIKGNKIENACLRGVNGPMKDPGNQMRIYRGNLKTGGSYGWFQWQLGEGTLLINVFNGNKDWKLQVYENGSYAGDAVFVSNSYSKFDGIKKGETFNVPKDSSQDWWAQAYHIGYLGRGTSSDGYCSSCYHMFKYPMKNPSASVRVVATDWYGNKYECSEITTKCYPDYIICEKN